MLACSKLALSSEHRDTGMLHHRAASMAIGSCFNKAADAKPPSP